MATTKELNQNVSLAADFVSDTWDVRDYKSTSIQFTWIDADATDAEAIPQVSNDSINWDVADNPSNVLLTISGPTGTKMWVFREELAVRYIRLSFTANSNTAGTAQIRSFGHDKNLGYK